MGHTYEMITKPGVVIPAIAIGIAVAVAVAIADAEAHYYSITWQTVLKLLVA